MDIAAGMRAIALACNIIVVSPDSSGLFEAVSRKTVRVTTGRELLVAINRRGDNRNIFSSLRCVLCENLELLDAAYELGVSLLLHATQQHPVRFVGLSTSLSDPADLAAWLNVDPLALHSFRPRDRDQSLSVSTQTFTIPQSAALFKAMAKPAHAAIRSVPDGPAIVFVPSPNMCRSTALDLITQCALEMETARGYLPEDVSVDNLEHYLVRLQDPTLADFITRGVGFFHNKIAKPDQRLMLELYAEGLLRVLIVPRDACWTLPVRAVSVVVMGTQYVYVSPGTEERQVREYGLEEIVRMQGKAVLHDGAGHFHLFCQAESKDTITRFLGDGLPLESRLLETYDLRAWYREQQRDGDIVSKQQAVDALSFTFLARRLVSNPAYYDAQSTSVNELLSRMVDDLDKS